MILPVLPGASQGGLPGGGGLPGPLGQAFAKGLGRFRDGPWPLLSRKALAGFAPKAPPQPAGPLAWFRSGKVRHSPSPHPGCAKGPAGAREGPCPAARRALPGSAPKAPPQPAAKSVTARHLTPAARRALPGFAKGAARLREGSCVHEVHKVHEVHEVREVHEMHAAQEDG